MDERGEEKYPASLGSREQLKGKLVYEGTAPIIHAIRPGRSH